MKTKRTESTLTNFSIATLAAALVFMSGTLALVGFIGLVVAIAKDEDLRRSF